MVLLICLSAEAGYNEVDSRFTLEWHRTRLFTTEGSRGVTLKRIGPAYIVYQRMKNIPYAGIR